MFEHDTPGQDQQAPRGRWLGSRIVTWLVFALTLSWLGYVVVASLAR